MTEDLESMSFFLQNPGESKKKTMVNEQKILLRLAAVLSEEKLLTPDEKARLMNLIQKSERGV